MAIIKTSTFSGIYPVPTPTESGVEYVRQFVIDSSATNLAIGDFVQLMYIPDNAVITEVKMAATATLGTTEIALGIADALVTTALSTTFLAAAAHTTTAVRSSLLLQDTAAASRILAVAVSVEAESTNDIVVLVRYRAAVNGV